MFETLITRRFFALSRTAAIVLAAGLALTAIDARAQSGTITATQLSDSVHMLRGKGGNIAVSVGADGVIMIDDQFAPASKEIAKAIKSIDDRPIRFVINTHWHGDHTGGNKNFKALGATIVAHDNVRAEMIGRKFKNAQGKFVADDTLPVVTFRDRISFHLNGETVEITKVPASHTSGDAIVHFTGSERASHGRRLLQRPLHLLRRLQRRPVRGHDRGARHRP